MGDGAPGTIQPERVIRCVLWHARGAVLPGALVAALDRPQVQWKAWDSEYLALAEAMRLQGDALTRETPARVLVLVEPSRLQGVSEVLSVLERLRPRAPLWIFEGGPHPSLQGMSAAEARARLLAPKVSVPAEKKAEPARVTPVEAGPAPQVVTRRIGMVVPRPLGPRPTPKPPPPPLRLAGSQPEAPGSVQEPPVEPKAKSTQPPVENAASADSRPAAALLTEEEIEMLLSERPAHGKAPGKPGGNVR